MLGAVTEDDALNLTANISLGVTDVDLDTLTYTIVGGGAGQYGTASVDAGGNFTYTLNNATIAVQALTSAGEGTEAFTVQVSDTSDEMVSVDVTATVNGVNDPLTPTSDLFIAEASYVEGGFVEEPNGNYDEGYGNYDEGYGNYEGAYVQGGFFADPLDPQNPLTGMDVLANDIGDGELSVTYYGNYYYGYNETNGGYYASQVSDGYFGTLTLESNEIVFTQGNGFLGVDTFSYTVADQIDTSTPVGVTVVSVDSAALTLAVVGSDGSAFTTANALITGNSPVGNTFASNDLTLGLLDGGVSTTSIVGDYGTVTIAQDGTWTYTLSGDLSAAQAALAASVTGVVEEEFTLQIIDSTGGYDTTTLTAVVLAETAEISIASTVQNLTGTAGADLLLGSDLADTIDGGPGADVILGFTGNDSLDGGVGDDFIAFSGAVAAGLNGGAGRDVLSVMFDGTVDLQALNATSIEAIDLTNTTAQNLEMSLADLIAIFATGDIDLNAVLNVEAPSLIFDVDTTLTILGDTSDFVSIVGLDVDEEFQPTANVVQAATGETLSIWQIVNTGTGGVFATLGIDTDVTVNDGVGLSQ